MPEVRGPHGLDGDLDGAGVDYGEALVLLICAQHIARPNVDSDDQIPIASGGDTDRKVGYRRAIDEIPAADLPRWEVSRERD